MKLIDSHTHMNFRSRLEFADLVSRGYEAAITCAFSPIAPRSADSALDSFDLMISRYSGEKEGLKIYATVGMHPRSIPRKEYKDVVDALPEFLKRADVVGMGEVGLETGTGLEPEVLSAQLRVAREAGAKVVMHTPRENKETVLQRELMVISSSGIDPAQVVIDHNSEATIGEVLRGGFYAGLTVGKGKLDQAAAIRILKAHEHYADRIMVNTGMGYGTDYLYALVDAAAAIENAMGAPAASGACCENARRFFGI